MFPGGSSAGAKRTAAIYGDVELAGRFEEMTLRTYPKIVKSWIV